MTYFPADCEYIIKQNAELVGNYTESTSNVDNCQVRCSHDIRCLGFEQITNMCRFYWNDTRFEFLEGNRTFHVKLCNLPAQGNEDTTTLLENYAE